MRWIDSPVSGGIGAAAAGTLTFMVGCPEPKWFDVRKSWYINMKFENWGVSFKE